MLKRLVMNILAKYRARQSSRIPYVELEQKHIANLKTLLHREHLLEHLPPNGVVAEVGVERGDFSQLILEKKCPERLYLIDWWAGKAGQADFEIVQKRFAREIEIGKVQLCRGRSVDVLAQFPKSHFDWIYLDTDHSYETTTAELLLCTNILKPNGLVLGHDYLTGNWDGGIRYGVVEAVNEFCVRHDWEFLFLTAETHRHLSFAIRQLNK